MPTIYQIVIIALIVAFVVLVLDKTNMRYKLRDKCELLGLAIMSKMLNCDFCFSFWLSVVLAIILSIMTKNSEWLITPFLSTPIIRILI